MADLNAGTIRASLKLDDDGFSSGLKKAIENATGTQKALMAMGAAATAVGAAVAVMVQQSADYTDKLGKQAQMIGMTTEQLSSYALAASLSDLSTEEFGKSVSLLSRKMVDAASGNEQAQATFKQLGLSVTDANGKLKTSDKMLEEIATSFSGAKDGAVKTAAAMDLMGKSGASMIPLLNGGAEEIKNIRKEAEEMGLVFSEKVFRAAEQFNDDQTRIAEAAKGLRQQISATIIDLVNESGAFDMVSDAIKSVTKWWMSLDETTRKNIVQSGAVVAGILAVAGALTVVALAASAVTPAMIAATVAAAPFILTGAAIAGVAVLIMLKWKELHKWIQPVLNSFQSSFESIARTMKPFQEAFSRLAKIASGPELKKIDLIATGLKAAFEPAAEGAVIFSAALKTVADIANSVMDGMSGLMDMLHAVIEFSRVFAREIKKDGVDSAEAFKRAWLTRWSDQARQPSALFEDGMARAQGASAKAANAMVGNFKNAFLEIVKLRKGILTETSPGESLFGQSALGDKKDLKPPPIPVNLKVAGVEGGTKPLEGFIKDFMDMDPTLQGLIGVSGKHLGIKFVESFMDGTDEEMAQAAMVVGRSISLVMENALKTAQQIAENRQTIVQNNLRNTQNQFNLFSDIYNNNLTKQHEKEMEMLREAEDAKLDILRQSLDFKLALIDEEFYAKQQALKAELEAEKARIDAMTQLRIEEAELRSIDEEEKLTAIRIIQEDDLRQKQEAEEIYQQNLDGLRTTVNARTQKQAAENASIMEKAKVESDAKMKALDEKQLADKKDVAKRSAAVKFALELAGFKAQQQAARASAQMQYGQAIMSAILAGMQIAAAIPIVGLVLGPAATAMLTGIAAMGFKSTMSAIASAPPPMPSSELFAEAGGLLPGPRHSQGGVNVNAEGGEFIMPRGPAMANLQMLENMRQGKSTPNGININFYGNIDPAGRSVESVGRELGMSVRSYL